jgi:chaperonin GroEL (HSP60 family)
MTKEEAVQLTNEKINLIEKKIKYDNTIFKVSRFLIDQFEKDNYKVIVCLEKEKGVEFKVDLSDFTDYEIV